MQSDHGRVFRELERPTEAGGNALQTMIADAVERIRESEALMAVRDITRAFDDVRIDRELIAGEHERKESRSHGIADVKRLAHRADILPHTGHG